MSVPLPETIGIESRIKLYLPPGPASGQPADAPLEFAGSVRIEFRITTAFPAGDWVEVEAVARVFDHEYVQRYRRSPENHLAEGQVVPSRARAETTILDIPLPSLPFAHHALQAKVYSRDARYRKLFEPSHCFLAIVPYGFVSRARLQDLRDIYAGVGNPIAAEEIKRQVRDGAIIGEEDGVLFSTREVNGQLAVAPLG